MQRALPPASPKIPTLVRRSLLLQCLTPLDYSPEVAILTNIGVKSAHTCAIMHTQCMARCCTHTSSLCSPAATVRQQLRSRHAAAQSSAPARLVRLRHAQPLQQRQSTVIFRAEGRRLRACHSNATRDPDECATRHVASAGTACALHYALMMRRGHRSSGQTGDHPHRQRAGAPAEAACGERRRRATPADRRQIRRLLRPVLQLCSRKSLLQPAQHHADHRSTAESQIACADNSLQG